MKNVLFIMSAFIFFSCVSSSEESAWYIAENAINNKEELVRFLTYYKEKGNDEKYKAALDIDYLKRLLKI